MDFVYVTTLLFKVVQKVAKTTIGFVFVNYLTIYQTGFGSGHWLNLASAAASTGENTCARSITRMNGLKGFGLLNPQQTSNLKFALDLVSVRLHPDGTLKSRKSGAAPNPLAPVIADILDKTNLEKKSPSEQARELDLLMDRLLEVYNLRFSTPVTSQRYLNDGIGEPHSLEILIQNDLYRKAKQQYTDDWQMVGNLKDVRNPLMRGLRREIWWDRYQGDHPIGDVRISRQTAKLPDGSETLHSIEVIRTFPDGSAVPFVFEVDANGIPHPLQLSRDNIMKVKRCFACHSSDSGHFAKVIKLNGYSPSPDWLIDDDNKLFPRFLPYEHPDR